MNHQAKYLGQRSFRLLSSEHAQRRVYAADGS